MTDRIGQKIGNYRLVRLLGQGGFAEVYLAEHLYLGSFAAIKLLSVRVAQDDIAQFQQEGRMLAELLHPHIVRVLDFGIEDRTPYLVMDYASGGTLRTRHPKGSRVPLPTVVKYVKQTTQALQYAHDRKFIHRDIKPENMLISREGTILLSDFGIAVISRSERSSLNSLAGTGGTPYYMAPELFQGKPRTASDQYSMGIVVYEWLCGTPPFSEGNAIQLGYQHTYQPVPPLRQQVSTLSPTIEQVVMTALAKKPEDRFGSIRAFATALEQASLDTPIQPLRSPVSPPVPQPLPDALPVVQSKTTLSNQVVYPRSKQPTSPDQSVPSSPPETSLPQPMVPSLSTPPSVRLTFSTSHKSKSEPVKRTLSRRTILLGAAGVVTAGIIGTVVWGVTHPIQGTLFVTYGGHSDVVTSVAWSPDGTHIASGSNDTTVQVWDAHDGSQPFTYRRHSDVVWSAMWSPDGTHIASGSSDKTVQVWNAQDGSQPFAYRGYSYTVYSIAWSPDSKLIASGSEDGAVQLWNARDGSQPFTYQSDGGIVWSVVWSPNGTRIASGSNDGTVQIWNARDSSQPFIYHGHNRYVSSVAWSPDGTRIASASDDRTVQVWNVRDGSQPFTYHGHSYAVNSVAWSPDGMSIASASADKTVQVWHAHDGSQPFTYRGHSDVVLSVAWSPDGMRIASASADKTVQVWQAV